MLCTFVNTFFAGFSKDSLGPLDLAPAQVEDHADLTVCDAAELSAQPAQGVRVDLHSPTPDNP